MATYAVDDHAYTAQRLAEIQAEKAAELAKTLEEVQPEADQSTYSEACKPADCGDYGTYGMGFCEAVCGQANVGTYHLTKINPLDYLVSQPSEAVGDGNVPGKANEQPTDDDQHLVHYGPVTWVFHCGNFSLNKAEMG